jgi:hypothetical protein
MLNNRLPSRCGSSLFNAPSREVVFPAEAELLVEVVGQLAAGVPEAVVDFLEEVGPAEDVRAVVDKLRFCRSVGHRVAGIVVPERLSKMPGERRSA